MIAFRETMVFTPNGRVVSTHAFIIGRGPMATTRSGFWVSQTSFSAWVTKPALPYEPSSVQTTRSSQCFPNRSSQKMSGFERKPMIPVVRLPASLNARSWGYTGATPRPPPTSTTWPTFSTCWGRPRGPTKSEKVSPSAYLAIISRVVLPSAWITIVIVPRRRS